MAVNQAAVTVRMGVHHGRFFGVRWRARVPGTEKAIDIHGAQENQHKADGEFHGEPDARRDYNVKKNDEGAYDKDGKGVSDAPEYPGERGLEEIALAADYGGDRHNVIRIGGVSHTKKKSHRKNGDEVDHEF